MAVPSLGPLGEPHFLCVVCNLWYILWGAMGSSIFLFACALLCLPPPHCGGGIICGRLGVLLCGPFQLEFCVAVTLC